MTGGTVRISNESVQALAGDTTSGRVGTLGVLTTGVVVAGALVHIRAELGGIARVSAVADTFVVDALRVFDAKVFRGRDTLAALAGDLEGGGTGLGSANVIADGAALSGGVALSATEPDKAAKDVGRLVDAAALGLAHVDSCRELEGAEKRGEEELKLHGGTTNKKDQVLFQREIRGKDPVKSFL